MSHWAYLVIWVNTETAAIDGIAVYSDRFVTSTGKHFPIVVAEESGSSYEEARSRVIALLNSPFWAWLGRFLPAQAPTPPDPEPR